MPSAPVIRVVLQREQSDCGIAALAAYLDISYEDVLRAVTVTDRMQGRHGLWSRTLQRVAKRLGHRLVIKRTFDLEEDRGILRLPEHAAILWAGLVINTDGTIWDADAFLNHWAVDATDCHLLVSED